MKPLAEPSPAEMRRNMRIVYAIPQKDFNAIIDFMNATASFYGDVQNQSGSGNTDPYAGANVRGAGRFGGESGGFEAERRETDGLYHNGCAISFGEQRGKYLTGWEDTRAFFFSTERGSQYTNSYSFGYNFQNEKMDDSLDDRNGYCQRSAHCVGLPFLNEIVPPSTDTEESPESAAENQSNIQLLSQAVAQSSLNQQDSKKNRQHDYEYTL